MKAWIAGKVDHYDLVTGQISDYKSVNSFGKKLTNLGLPKQHHVAQLWIYAWLLGQAGYPYPVTGRLIYMDMGAVYTCDVAMPDTELQAQVEARIVEKARIITEAGSAGPAGDPLEAWACRYCGHADGCAFRLDGNAPSTADGSKTDAT